MRSLFANQFAKCVSLLSIKTNGTFSINFLYSKEELFGSLGCNFIFIKTILSNLF